MSAGESLKIQVQSLAITKTHPPPPHEKRNRSDYILLLDSSESNEDIKDGNEDYSTMPHSASNISDNSEFDGFTPVLKHLQSSNRMNNLNDSTNNSSKRIQELSNKKISVTVNEKQSILKSKDPSKSPITSAQVCLNRSIIHFIY